MDRDMMKFILIASLFGVSCGQMNFSDSVEQYFGDLQKLYPSTSYCIDTARNKMNQFSKFDSNKQHAVALVNLYTQSCSIGSGTFYGELNRNLRTNATSFWKNTESLLNEGMVILGEEIFADVYRGCSNKAVFQPGAIYHFNQFISTSTHKSVAKAFAKSILFNMKNASGLDVAIYSAYPSEKEILLKSSSTFRVLDVTTEGAYKFVVLQHVHRVSRADDAVEEAFFCQPETTNAAACLSNTITASLLTVPLSFLYLFIMHA